MILDICDNAETLEVLRIVKIIIQIIRIAVPIILILAAMIDYMNAIKDNDELAKTSRLIVKKLVAAILVFLIPTFVSIISNLIFGENNYINCLNMATSEHIDEARYTTAQKYVDMAKESLKLTDYQTAKSYIQKIKDDTKRSELEKSLEEVKEYIDLREEILKLKNNYDKNKYREIYDKVDKIKDAKIKEEFMKMLEEIGVGRPLNVSDGTYRRTYDGKQYVEVIPPNATTNLPLLIFLHGDGENGCISCLESMQITKYVKSKKAYEIEDFIYIAILRPKREYASTYNITNIKKVIDYVVEQYEIDKDRIYITGFSGGSIITWGMVNTYPDFFAAAMPVSCGGSINPNNFKTTPIWSMAGTSGDAEAGYNRSMSSMVRNIKNAGGDAKHDTLSGESHGSMQGKVYNNIEVYKWLLSKTKKR